MKHVREKVKPKRDKNNNRASTERDWWRYGEADRDAGCHSRR